MPTLGMSQFSEGERGYRYEGEGTGDDIERGMLDPTIEVGRSVPLRAELLEATMLVLTFRVAEVPYAVAVKGVVEVVPRVELRLIPHAPKHLAGLLRYRGGVVPVVDLGLLMGEAACVDRLDTRIILVEAGSLVGGGSGLLGLVAERVEDVRPVDESRRAVAGLEIGDAPYLGPIYETDDGLLQLVDPGKILLGSAAEDVGGGSWA
jgi:chemotaxis-related protein WspB